MVVVFILYDRISFGRFSLHLQNMLLCRFLKFLCKFWTVMRDAGRTLSLWAVSVRCGVAMSRAGVMLECHDHALGDVVMFYAMITHK